MELRRFIHTGIAASAIGHLSVLAGILILAEVHPFGSVTAEPVSVDIVSPAEAPPPPKIEEPPPPKEQLSDSSDPSSKPQASSPPTPAAPQEAAAQPQKQPAASKPRPDLKQAAPEPPQPKPEPSSPPQAAALTPSPVPPVPAAPAAPPNLLPQQPDVSIKYHVLLGLPNERVGGFDSQAYKAADVDQSHIAAFRRHLKTCSTLPKSIGPTDPIKIMLRVSMTPDGKLAAEPILVEASASAKGPALMQSAISALQACQPYQMLPADRYGEWKVLDLSFTPQDF